jgi:hypothetical protein
MRRICTIAAFAVLLATTAMANLLTNGNFGSGTFTPSLIPAFDGGDALFVGSTAMTGWTVVDSNGLTVNTAQSMAWLPNGSYGISSEGGSNYFLDLTGYYDASGEVDYGVFAGVEQTVTLAAGNYALSFYLGDDGNVPNYTGTVTVLVSAGNVKNVIASNTSQQGINWQLETVDFTVATAGPTPITILGDTSTGGQYIGLDNVDLESIPEPGSALLGFLGVAGLLIYSRRRTSAV